MLSKIQGRERGQYQMVVIDELVPKNHLVRDLAEAISFDFIYEEVKDMYSEDKGRPSIDPVVLFKMIFIQFMFDIRSMRQTVKEIEVNMAYRWFLGLDITDSVPHFGTFSKNYERRFRDTDIFDRVFKHILREAIDCGFVNASSVFIDSTPIKANANKKKKTEEIVKHKTKVYKRQLEEEISEDREENNKKPIDFDDDEGDTKTVTKSTTDPDAGVLRKGEHQKIFAYSAHTVCDKNNFVLNATVTAANEHDSTVFDEVYEETKETVPECENIVVDAAYKTPWIAKKIIDDGKIPFMPYKRPMTKKGYFKKYEYTYDPYYDHYVCPNGEILSYSTTNKTGYREYKSKSKTCELCEQREQCTNSKNFTKVMTRHLWSGYLDIAEEIRHSQLWKDIYPQRSHTIERVFGDAKEKHRMRYAQFRGLKKVKMQVLITFACMNLKKLAKWKKLKGLTNSFFHNLKAFFSISSFHFA